MEIDWIHFILALALLFYPLDRSLGGRVRLHDYEGASNQLGSSGVWWGQFWLWADPLRGFTGAWLCVHAFTTDLVLPEFWRHSANAGILLVIACALVVQMHTRREDDVVLAPIGFSAGVIFAFLPPLVALPVVVLAGACLAAFRSLGAFFLCGAIGAGVLGCLMLGPQPAVVAVVVLTLQPVLLSSVMYRRMRLPLVRKLAGIKPVELNLSEAQGACVEKLVRQPQQ